MTKYQIQFMPQWNTECDLTECNLFHLGGSYLCCSQCRTLFQAQPKIFQLQFSKRLVAYLGCFP